MPGAPSVSRYAQEARSYATVSALVVIASYLLVRALGDRRRRWWVGYGAAIALGALFNLLALLIVPAHAITVAIVSRRSRAARCIPNSHFITFFISATCVPRHKRRRMNRAGPVHATPAAAPVAGPPASAAAHGTGVAQRQIPHHWGARSWAVAVGAALVVLIPLFAAAYSERAATSWLGRPGWPQVGALISRSPVPPPWSCPRQP